MAYAVQAGRVVKMARGVSVNSLARSVKKAFGIDQDSLNNLMHTNPDIASRVFHTMQAVQSPDFRHTNPQHNRRLRKQYDITARQQRKDDKAYKRAMSTANRTFYDKPFDDIDLDDGGRCYYGGRC